MTKKTVVKWFKPKGHSGFLKSKSVAWNVKTVLKNSKKDYVVAIRAMNALSNVTTDSVTKKKARAVQVALSKKYANK